MREVNVPVKVTVAGRREIQRRTTLKNILTYHMIESCLPSGLD